MRRASSLFTLQRAAQCAAPSLCAAPVHFLHYRGLPNAPRHLYVLRLFAGGFWRPSRCPNWACDSSLEIYLSLISNPSGIVQFGVHLPCQKSNLPRLVKMSRMRLPQGRVLLQSNFEGLPQLQIELMIARWKDIFV